MLYMTSAVIVLVPRFTVIGLMELKNRGNHILLLYTYTWALLNVSFGGTYMPLLQNAYYLAINGLNMNSQLCDDVESAIAIQTNLAIEAAIGLVTFGAFYPSGQQGQLGQHRSDALCSGVFDV